MEVRFKLSKFGKHLWTRARAKTIRPELLAQLEKLRQGDTLVIDLSSVEVFDFSFANELFGKTLLSLRTEYVGRFLVVENLTDYTRENLDQALRALGLAIIERKGTELSLLGKAHAVDHATFAVIARAGAPMTAATLRDQLGVNLTAMNERLSKLVALGVARREKTASAAGREQYEYRVLA